MKNNIFRVVGLFLILSALLVPYKLAYAAKFAVNAGCILDTWVLNPKGNLFKDNNNHPADVGSKVQYFTLGNNGRIDGPNNVNVNSPTGDDVFVTENAIGASDTGQGLFTNQAGKFFYKTSSNMTGPLAINGTVNLYVRAWNGPDPATATLFGESDLIPAATGLDGNPAPVANEVGLNNFITMFPKAAPSPTANWIPTAVVNFNAVSNRFDAVIAWKSAFGARQYIVNQVDDMNGANPRPITPPDTIWNAEGRCSPNSTDPKSWTWPNLEELKKYYVRIEAKNTFGSALSEVLEINTPEYPDPNPPGALFDLRAEVIKDTPPFSVKLSWTAPSDRNKAGNTVKVSGYEIKASNEGPLKSIIYAPNAKPDPIDTYETAKTVNVLNYTIDPNIDPTGDPNNPNANVKGIDEVQEVTISNIPNRGLYFFAVKSIDAPVGAISNKSALSNLAAVQLGAGSAASFTLYPTDTQKLVVNTVFLSSAPVTDAAGLAAHINTFKGAKVVNAIAEWDLLSGSARSALFDANGALVSGSDNFNVYPGRCYQIYTSQQVDNLNL